MAKITLFSMYQYLNLHGTDLFESFSKLPDGIDKDVLCKEILRRGGEFGTVYSDPNFIKECADNWTDKWLHTIEKWLQIQNEKYNPLHNYDRHEEYTDTVDEKTSGSGTSNGTDNSTNTENRNTYDSDTLRPIGSAGTNATSNLSSTSSGSTDRTVKHEAHLYGNIGVTTASQLQIEARAAERWSLYENIACLFISEFCIPVYL